MTRLSAFSSEFDLPSVELSAQARWEAGGLCLEYHLQDPQRKIRGAPSVGHWNATELRREDELWKSTCFEAFWARPGEVSYWEFNVTADGRWNLYFFEGYRTPQPPQPSSDFILMSLDTDPESLRAILAPRSPIRTDLEIGFCAVLEPQKGPPAYFASSHRGPRPDFHLRNSLCQTLPAPSPQGIP